MCLHTDDARANTYMKGRALWVNRELHLASWEDWGLFLGLELYGGTSGTNPPPVNANARVLRSIETKFGLQRSSRLLPSDPGPDRTYVRMCVYACVPLAAVDSRSLVGSKLRSNSDKVVARCFFVFAQSRKHRAQSNTCTYVRPKRQPHGARALALTPRDSRLDGT